MSQPPLNSAPVPRATYRLQFHAGFRFTDAHALIPYLASLGISHVYASPLLKARPGSTHGYDVIDPGALNPEIGSEAEFEAFTQVLQAQGLQLLLDIVPNHMGVLEADNPWWLDVLENGPASAHARAFDIEWAPSQRELHGKLLMAVLGQPYGAALESGEIEPLFDARRGQFMLRYHTHRFPIDPADHGELLGAVPLPEAATAEQADAVAVLRKRFDRLPPRDAEGEELLAMRQREVRALKQALTDLHAGAAWAPHWLDTCAARLRGQPGDAASFDRLDTLLQHQAYRLAFWRAAGDELNYRRFFDVNALAALRVEDPAVFDASQALVLRWLDQGRIAGLRIDHPDGMADPEAYFARLQQGAGDAARYVVVEKILAEHEAWPREWPVHGDTGYRFAQQASAVFVDKQQAAAFDAICAQFTGAAMDFDAELDAAKRAIMSQSLAADLRLLTEMAHDVALQGRHTRDLTRNGLKVAIVEMAAAFDVYRSYVSARGVSAADRARIEQCAATARARCRPSQTPYVDFVRGLLLQAAPEGSAQLRWVQRFQQFTAPVMAKAMEDTVFYRYHRLVSLNDVGGDPRAFGLSVDAFHASNLARVRDMPHTLLATSTHDSKRSEDMRMRLHVLSEMPERWRAMLQRWRDLAQTQWRIGGLTALPAAGDELLLFQTLVGLWPLDLADDEALASFRERTIAYMLKAVREAKQHSSWLDGNDEYEQTLQRCIELLLQRLEPNPFLSDLRRCVAEIAPFGCVNSLALLALKLTSPGVPDIYQGCEDWFFALVDPDNRRPVDYTRMQQRAAAAQGDAGWRAAPLVDGLHKLRVTQAVLHWRRQAAALFRDGDYRPLTLEGPAADHLLAFARVHEGASSITLVPRLSWQVSEGDIDGLGTGAPWRDTALILEALGGATDVCENVITGRRTTAVRSGHHAVLPVQELLVDLPIAVLRPVGAA